MTTLEIFNPIILEPVPAGKWVAISEDQSSVLAFADTLEETVEAAAKLGMKNPFLIRKPLQNSALIL